MLPIVDIDECEQGIARCHQGCRNTDGGFICTCNEGYQNHHSDPSYCVGMSTSVNYIIICNTNMRKAYMPVGLFVCLDVHVTLTCI